MKVIHKEDYYLVFIFLLISVSILTASYFTFNGYLSPDSTNYLSVAQNIINGDGYIIPSKRMQPFAVWPIGYPSFIALISYITGLSVFWSSKILNIILIGLIFTILRKYYKENTYLVAIIFTWSSYMTLYFYTWSETIFIFALVLFSISLYEFFKNDNPNVIKFTMILLSMLLLFFSRYIGAFSFGVVGLIGLYYFYNKQYNISFKLIFISILSISIMALYLYNNYKITGFYTGMQRIESPETNIQLLFMLVKAFFYELIIPVHSGGLKACPIFLIQVLLFIFFYKKYGLVRSKNSNNYLLEKILLSIGIIYLLFIILIRWFIQFDGYDFRLLGPGTILIYIAFIGYLIKSKIILNNKWIKSFIILFSIISILINSVYHTVKNSRAGSYEDHILKVMNQLKDIPHKSIIVFPGQSIRYLRLDLSLATPHFKPYFKEKESINDFFNRIDCKNKNIFIDTSSKVTVTNFNKSVVDFYESLPKNKRFYKYKCK